MKHNGNSVQPLHIGLIGCSAQGAALCYETICMEGVALLGPHAHPEISTHTHPLSAYMEGIDHDDWDAVGALMLDSAQKLARAGADFLICPDNTIHRAVPTIEAALPLPWLHIVDAVTKEAVARGFRRVGLTGTRWLVESDLYPERLAVHGIDVVRPTGKDCEEINRMIFEELVCGQSTPAALKLFQEVVERMKEDGCDAIVMGCTEIPLILNDSNSPLPTLDSTRLLARAALKVAVSGRIS